MSREHVAPSLLSDNLGFCSEVLLWDDAEGTDNWAVVWGAGDYVQEYAAAAAFLGGHGIRMKTRVTDPAQYDELQLARCVGWPEIGTLAFRAMVSSPDWSKLWRCNLRLNLWTGAKLFAADLEFQPSRGTVAYFDHGNNEIEVPGLALTPIDGGWYRMGFAIDMVGETFRWVELAGQRVELTDFYEDWGASAVGRYLYVRLVVTTAAAAAAEVYWDNVYVGSVDAA